MMKRTSRIRGEFRMKLMKESYKRNGIEMPSPLRLNTKMYFSQ